MSDGCQVSAGNKDEGQLRVEENLKRIKHKLVVMSGKGGVGKSTVAVNLALALASRGNKVGIMDIDIHGPNVPKMLGLEDAKIETGKDGLAPVPAGKNLKAMSMAFLIPDRDTPVIWRGPLKMGAVKQFLGDVQWGDLDYLVIDLPPGTGDEPLSIAQLIPGDAAAIVVTTPQEVALLDSRKSITFARTLGMKIVGVVENMSGFACPHCEKQIDLFKVGGGENAASEMGVPFLGAIPIDPDIVSCGDGGVPFVGKNPDSSAAKAFQKIVENVESFVKKQAGA